MSPNEIVTQFRRNYEGTWVMVEMPDKPGKDNLFNLTNVSLDGDGGGIMHLSSNIYGKIRLNIGTEHKITFAFPKVGSFQHGADAYVFNRDPQRQWTRGMCHSNTCITNVGQPFLANTVRRVEHFSFELISAAFAGENYSFKDAQKMLSSGKHRSVALKDGFSLILSPTKAYKYLLLYWTNVIAGVKLSDSIAVFEQGFAPQIQKVITSW